jgi:hypothetical protein
VVYSAAGVLPPEEDFKLEDDEMKGPKKPQFFTGSKLNLKRDYMAVKPLFQQDGMSKFFNLMNFISRFRYPRRYLEHILDR